MPFENLLYLQGAAPDIVDEAAAPAVTYLGWVAPGTVDPSEPKFMIKRISVAAGITKTEWANGNRDFTNIWDNRAALPYSYIK
jgi:hypothetical protein